MQYNINTTMDENELIEDAIRSPDAFKKIIHLLKTLPHSKKMPSIFWIFRIATNVVISNFRAKSHLEKTYHN